MKKAFKIAALGLVMVVALLAGAALYIHISGFPHYSVEKVSLKVEVTPARVAEGRRIATLLCAACHLDSATGRLTGRRMEDLPPVFGVAFSRNITRHPVKGIGSWTDGEIAYLLRTGIARDGRYTPPWMVKLPRASDEEIASIIAFLRSDDPLVQATEVDNVESRPSFFAKFLSRVAFKPFPYPQQPQTAPPPTDRVAYGRHLALDLVDCYSCHSADFASVDGVHPERSKGFFGGGNTMTDFGGHPIHTANLTPDRQTGIGGWTEEDFVRAVKGGFRPDNTPILYPMQTYVELTDDEVRAIYAYLRTVPALRNAVPRPVRVAAANTDSRGKQIFYKYSCQSCHGEAGVGLCDLRANLKNYPTDEALMGFLRNPAATHPGSKMPAWEGVIEPDEYAPLVQYLRTLAFH